MARIYTCGFELQSTLEFAGYTTASITPTVSFPTPGRAGISGSRYFKMQTNGFGSGVQNNYHNFPARSEVFIRFGCYFVNGGGVGSTVGFEIRDNAGHNVLKLVGSQAGSTLVATIGDSTNGGTASGVFLSTWRLVEVHLKLDASYGEIEVKFDGINVYSYSGNTDPNNRTNAAQLIIWGGDWNNDYFGTDDVAVNDTSGSEQNSWCGNGTTLYLVPNADGDSSQMLGSDGNSVNNYQLVDDNPHDGDATYVSADATGLKDEYNLASLPTLASGSVIVLVQPVAVARRADPEVVSSLDIGIKSDTTENFASSQTLVMYHQLYRGSVYYVDPADSASWDTTKVNALQIGIRSA